MRPTEITALLAKTIPAGYPVMITGAPGVGKSDVIDQAVKAAEADLIMTHPSVGDPTDVKGLPWANADAMTANFLPFGDLARAMAAKKRTAWVFEDLGQATPAMQAACMQLFLARRVNDHIIPDCVTFMAATNRRTDKAGVSGILEPVKSRFVTIVQLDVNLDDWCLWAFSRDIPAELIAFLRFRPELLSKFEPTADLTNSPMPRTWAHAAKVMALDLPDHISHGALVGAVGEGAAVEFAGFRRLYRELPAIDGILIDPDASKIPTAPAALYAVATALGMKAKAENFARIARYAERLTKANHGEFATLMLRDAVRRDASIMQTAAFVKLASGELGQLIAGGVA